MVKNVGNRKKRIWRLRAGLLLTTITALDVDKRIYKEYNLSNKTSNKIDLTTNSNNKSYSINGDDQKYLKNNLTLKFGINQKYSSLPQK